ISIVISTTDVVGRQMAGTSVRLKPDTPDVFFELARVSVEFGLAGREGRRRRNAETPGTGLQARPAKTTPASGKQRRPYTRLCRLFERVRDLDQPRLAARRTGEADAER